MMSVLVCGLSMPLSMMVVATSTSILPVANCTITSSTSRGLIFRAHAHTGLGRRLVHALHRVLDGLHAVRHVVHLAAAPHLQADGRRDHIDVLAHVHAHRTPARGRRGDEAHVAHPRKRHLHGARNGGRREREHIDLLADVLELLFMLDAEPLLLVDDDKPQVVRVHIGRQQAMRAHQHVHLACRERGEGPGRCCAGVRKRLSTSTSAPNGAKRSKNVSKCCWARIVVGQSTMTWRPPVNALEGRTQRHLGLPNPTSPHSRRSMGLVLSPYRP